MDVMPINPSTKPIAAAAPRDMLADIGLCSVFALADEAVGDGLRATVAVKTTVTDPGKTPEAVDDGRDVEADVDVLVVVDARVVFVDKDPIAVLLKMFPEYSIASPVCTDGVV